jgi:glycine/D-amino acid oxidase-like deaminating enzyme
VTAERTVAVLGAGIMGASTALYLARRGARVVLFDEADAAFSGASRWNEGKIHLGYLYSAAPTLDTAQRMVPGGLAFKPLVEDLIGRSIAPATAAEDDTYLIHRDSVVSADHSRAYFEAIARLVRAHPDAAGYLADARESSVTVLTPREVAALADPEAIVAGFRVLERSVSTRWIAGAYIEALAAEPRITTALREHVTAVTSPRGTGEAPWYVVSASGTHGPFDAVVNALWHGRPAIDRGVADCADRQQHYRYRVALFVRSSRPLSIPSLLIGVGPYGDIKNYNGRDFYLSWYPVGRLVESDGTVPPVTPVLDDAAKRDIAERVFDALSAMLPAVATLRDCAEEISVGGGWVYAQARGTLDDPRSTLHQRDRLGIKWFGTYASVDTGKYSVAPYLARAVADHLMAT